MNIFSHDNSKRKLKPGSPTSIHTRRPWVILARLWCWVQKVKVTLPQNWAIVGCTVWVPELLLILSECLVWHAHAPADVELPNLLRHHAEGFFPRNRFTYHLWGPNDLVFSDFPRMPDEPVWRIGQQNLTHQFAVNNLLLGVVIPPHLTINRHGNGNEFRQLLWTIVSFNSYTIALTVLLLYGAGQKPDRQCWNVAGYFLSRVSSRGRYCFIKSVCPSICLSVCLSVTFW